MLVVNKFCISVGCALFRAETVFSRIFSMSEGFLGGILVMRLSISTFVIGTWRHCVSTGIRGEKFEVGKGVSMGIVIFPSNSLLSLLIMSLRSCIVDWCLLLAILNSW